MGTWKLPTNKKEKASLIKKLHKLRKLQDEINSIYGDDIVMDGFDMASGRIEQLVSHLTEDCKHPAYYGEALGVCASCRLNVEESK